jgi:hypothetical protein
MLKSHTRDHVKAKQILLVNSSSTEAIRRSIVTFEAYCSCDVTHVYVELEFCILLGRRIIELCISTILNGSMAEELSVVSF